MAEYQNHLKAGNIEVIHKDKIVVTSHNSTEFKRYLDSLDDGSYLVGTIPPGFEHRADKIADLFYGSPQLDWIVCWTNNIYDPFQQLNVGDRIRILNV
jgi:hypothetical protein